MATVVRKRGPRLPGDWNQKPRVDLNLVHDIMDWLRENGLNGSFTLHDDANGVPTKLEFRLFMAVPKD